MLKFLARILAVIGFLAVLLIAALCLLAAHMRERAATEPQNVVLTLDFDRPITEQPDNSPLSYAMDGGNAVPLLDILRAIDRAAADPHVRGLTARFGSEQPSLTQAQEIRAAIARFRKTGKFTYAFGTDYGEYGLGSRAYYLASAFENIWLQPVGTVSLTGVALSSPFAKSALDKIGVTADFMQRMEYKSLMEPAMRDSFSPPVRAEMQAMIENLADQVAAGIAASRGWDIPHAREIMAQGPFTDSGALQNGLVTRLGYADQFDAEIDAKSGPGAKQADAETYLSYPQFAADNAPAAKIALIYGTGLITERDSGGEGLLGRHVMGADAIVRAFDAAAADKDVKAILFRIDSPGGSPAASETIRRAMIHAKARGKKVVVSMGGMGASGGYWIAMNADRIVADPATLTGSIGVVAGKFALGGALQKLGISMDRLSTSDNADMWDMTQAFTDPQRARVNALLDSTYRAFVSNVSDARHIPMEKMPGIAGGRVWTGAQAVGIGLVDELGGYDAAVAAVRKLLGLSANARLDLEPFPPPPTPAERLLKLMHRLGAESAAYASNAAVLARAAALAAPFLAALEPQTPVAATFGAGWLR